MQYCNSKYNIPFIKLDYKNGYNTFNKLQKPYSSNILPKLMSIMTDSEITLNLLGPIYWCSAQGLVFLTIIKKWGLLSISLGCYRNSICNSRLLTSELDHVSSVNCSCSSLVIYFMFQQQLQTSSVRSTYLKLLEKQSRECVPPTSSPLFAINVYVNY